MKKNFNKTKGSKISVKLLLVFTSLVLSVACSNNSNTATTTPDPTITVTAVAQRVAGSVTVTWTEPSAANFLGVAITQTLAGTTSAPVRVAKGTTTHTFTGLTGGSAYTITVSAVNGSGTLAAGTVSTSTVATATATPLATDAIALFSLGAQDGDFGFAACQTAIDDNAVTPNLRSRGYTQARFFGSTDTYGFINIATDAQALAITGGTAIAGNLAAFTSNTGTTAPIRTFGATASTTGSEAPVTLANMLAVTGTGTMGSFQNGGQNVLTHLGVGATSATHFWSFSVNGVYSSSNCTGATSNTSGGTILGIVGDRNALITTVNNSPPCSNVRLVLCIAR